MMKINDIVVIQRGPFASYHARVVKVHTGAFAGTFEGEITMFGRTGTIMFSMNSLLPEQPVADTRTRTERVREEYRTLRAANVPHEDAVLEAAINCGFDVFDRDEETVTAPAWVWNACK